MCVKMSHILGPLPSVCAILQLCRVRYYGCCSHDSLGHANPYSACIIMFNIREKSIHHSYALWTFDGFIESMSAIITPCTRLKVIHLRRDHRDRGKTNKEAKKLEMCEVQHWVLMFHWSDCLVQICLLKFHLNYLKSWMTVFCMKFVHLTCYGL